MIDEARIEEVLRPQPEVEAGPFFTRRVMHAIRQPEPLAFPWRRVFAGAGAAVAALALVRWAAADVDAVACAAFAVAALVTAGVERVVAVRR